MAITARMKAMLHKTKSNLVLQHDADDELLLGFIAAAISYAETYQHKSEDYYSKRGNRMSATTEQAVVMLASHFYESRDGSTGGFFADNVQAAQQVWNTVHTLLRMRKDWQI